MKEKLKKFVAGAAITGMVVGGGAVLSGCEFGGGRRESGGSRQGSKKTKSH